MPSPLAVTSGDDRARVVGILNITPDSFSDGGRFMDPRAALDHALRMQSEGADMIDVGAESTRPGSVGISAEEELSRLTPVLEFLLPKITVPLSVDTSKIAVMREALRRGVRVINDVRAMRSDPGVPRLLAENQAGVILMHSRGNPSDMQNNTAYVDLAGEVIAALRDARDRALSAGIKREDIVVDPGIGFGKSAEANWELLRLLPRLKAELGQEMMVGLSRKSFLSKTFGASNGDLKAPMAAAHLAALAGGARFLRMHDIIEARQVIRTFELSQGSPCS